MDELSRGVGLRPLSKCVTVTKCPLPVETPPFDQLLLDIQCRRYTLRKVQVCDDFLVYPVCCYSMLASKAFFVAFTDCC